MDHKDYSPMGQVISSHLSFLAEEMKSSWTRLENLQELSKKNQFADESIQEMIYSERRVWSVYKHTLANLETELKTPAIKPEL